MDFFLIIVFGLLNVLIVDDLIKTVDVMSKIKANNELIEPLKDTLSDIAKGLYFYTFIILCLSFILQNEMMLLTAILLIGNTLFKKGIEKEIKAYYEQQ